MIRSLVRPLSRPLVRRLVGGLGTSEFDWLQYEPYHLIDLTTAALKTGGDPAGLFDSVATLSNTGTGSDLTQTTASLQGQYLSHENQNYLRCSRLSGNVGEFNAKLIPPTADFSFEVDVVFQTVGWPINHIVTQYRDGIADPGRMTLWLNAGVFNFFCNGTTNVNLLASFSAVAGVEYRVKVVRVGDTFSLYVNDVLEDSGTGDVGHVVYQRNTRIGGGGFVVTDNVPGCISRFNVTTGGTQYGLNFNEMSHGQTSYVCNSGETLTINSSGDDPAYVIAYPCLRTDGVDDWYKGTFDSAKNGAYVFLVADDLNAASSYDRFVSMGPTGQNDTHSTSYIPSTANTGKLSTYHSSGQLLHTSTTPKRFLHEIKFLNGEQTSLVNGVDLKTGSLTIAPNLQEIGLNGKFDGGSGSRPPMQYAFMAAFPPTLDSDAVTAIRAELNRRFKLF